MIKHGEPPYLECSSKGDKRFSAFHARIKSRNNKSIEEIYQGSKIILDAEGRGKTGFHWKSAKGKKAFNQDYVTELYAKLWQEYIDENPELLDVLREATGLSDMFGKKGSMCQATELWKIRNKPRHSMFQGS